MSYFRVDRIGGYRVIKVEKGKEYQMGPDFLMKKEAEAYQLELVLKKKPMGGKA